MIFRFGEVQLDVGAHELARAGERVPIEPQVFDVLVHLVRHRDRVVPKTELLDEIWGDRFVSESALTSRIKSARRAVGDTGRDQRIIRTIHGRGFRFVAEVDELTAGSAGAGTTPAGSGASNPRDPIAGGANGSGEPGDGADADVVTVVADLLAQRRGGAVELVGGSSAQVDRLLEEVYERAARAGHLVGRGSGAGAGLRPYGCVLDAVDELAQRAPGLLDPLPEACRDELDRVLGGAQPLIRPRLFLGVRELLVAATGQRPTLVVLDELHYADPDTVTLLHDVSRLTAHHPLVVVAARGPGPELGGRFRPVPVPDLEDGDAASTRPSLPGNVLDVLRLVALEGSSFDLRFFRTAAGMSGDGADRLLDMALVAGAIQSAPTGSGYRLAWPGFADELLAAVPPHRLALLHGQLADRMIAAGSSPEQVAHHLIAAHRQDEAVPFAIEAVLRADAQQRYPEVLRWTDVVLDQTAGDERRELLARRASALAATGDPTAVHVYREAIELASGAEADRLRTAMARVAVLSGDLETTRDALAAIDPAHAGPQAQHVEAMLRYFEGDLDRADELLSSARAASGDAPLALLDVISLQGLIAHNRGEWFDRLRRELRTTRDSPDLALRIFDGHLCVAEYLLYGPTPYAEVIELARDLRTNAEERGARRAVAFAACVMGEARLLAGELDEARRDLEESVRLHREMSADAGTAHSLQRLAELELAAGDPSGATALLREAIVLARWSPLSHHLLQRAYGTLIAAAPDRDTAAAIVDEAAAVLDAPGRCDICQVMVEVPAAIACAEAGRVDDAHHHLERARWSAAMWQGTAWQAACTEAAAAIALAEGRAADASEQLTQAVALFERAGQPLDAARCREAAGDLLDAV